jgi:hypothetical protein
MNTDLTKFDGPYQSAIKALAESWEGSHVKIIGIGHPWEGETGRVTHIDMFGVKPAVVIRLDRFSHECAVFSGKHLKKI